MTIDGSAFSGTANDERARGAGHAPVILSGVVKADQGDLPVGLIVSKDSDDKIVPYEAVDGEVIEVGTGDTKAYTGALAKFPIEPGTLVITDGVEAFSDDGLGRLTGDAGGSGTIVYATGAYAITFNANVINEADVEADYERAFHGVLDEDVDTTKQASGLYIPHGSVRQDVLKVGAVTQAAPGDALLARLIAKGVYPE